MSEGIVWVGLGSVGVVKAKVGGWDLVCIGSALVGLLFLGSICAICVCERVKRNFFLLRCIICCEILYIFSTSTFVVWCVGVILVGGLGNVVRDVRDNI
jgi:ribosomal protein S27E